MDSYPYLGVAISSDLRWDRHVTVISIKSTWALNFVRRNIYRCTPEAKELLYTSLVLPLMEFAAPTRDPYRVKYINKLEMVQRRAARTFCQIRLSSYNLVDYLGWRTLSDAPPLLRVWAPFDLESGV